MKKTRTLSSRLSLIFIGGMALTILAGGITTYCVQDKIVDDLTNARLKNSVYESSESIQETLLRAEATVEDAEFTTESRFTTVSQLTDDSYVTTSLHDIQVLYELPAKHYETVCSYWLILNPEYSGTLPEDPNGKGFFYVRNDSGEFDPHGVTNILHYAETDTEHIGWWIAIKNDHKPVWTEPYYNANINKNMFSYIRPVFSSSNDLLGAVGIDVDLSLIINLINNNNEYKDSSSILLNKDGKVIYHDDVKTFDENNHYIGTNLTLQEIFGIDNFKESESGAIIYRYEGRRRNAMSIELENGFVYGLSVRTGELRKPLRLVTFIPMLVYVGSALIILLIVYALVRRHFKPLRDLNEAVESVEQGKMEMELKPKHNDEIGKLTESFSRMVSVIAEKNKMISAMAFLDGLTGVKNKNAHRETVKRLDKEIAEGKARFAVVMLDVNNLKMINDNLGHEGGDKAIIGSCYALCKGFCHSPVYRIGGDEFVAIVEGDDYENRQEIYDKLHKNEIDVKNEKYDFAVGMATYEPGVDKFFNDVFSRADQEMYINKKASKNNE